jgi:GNAT superfamily N-acetyltransferase
VDSVVITTARAKQIADIPRIERAAAALFAEADLPQHIRHRVTAAADLRHAMDDDRLWVAILNGRRTIGYAMADIVDDEAYLTEVDVLPEFGRRGIGTQLVNTVVKWAASSGFDTLALITFRHLPWNAPFYEKLGFSCIDPAEHGPELSGLIEEEQQIGIDTANRVAMQIIL